MRSYIGENEKVAVPELTEEQKVEREAKIKAFQESIFYYEESPFKINITRDERNIMMSFESEEYSSIIERMKKDAPQNYAKHKTALEEARANGDTSGVFREYAGAYKWAYGDIFQMIEKQLRLHGHHLELWRKHQEILKRMKLESQKSGSTS